MLGAGGGWAKSVLFNERLKEQFRDFFHREDTFALGVCNGCQMLSQLKSLIPGADHWPRFVRNTSAQFEARLSQVEVLPTPSILLAGMEGSTMPIPVAHGEGRTEYQDTAHQNAAAPFAALRYTDSQGTATQRYPAIRTGPKGD